MIKQLFFPLKPTLFFSTLLITLIKLFALPCWAANHHMVSLAQISKMYKKVYVNNRPAEIQQKLTEGDQITVNSLDGFAQITYRNGAKFMIKNGTLKVEKLNPQENIINLERGVLFMFMEKGPQETFRITTKFSSLGIRGTKFFVKESPEETYLCVCEGVVRVKHNIKGMVDITRNEDIHINQTKQLIKQRAGERMWNMAVEGLAEMDIKVRAR